jgi:FMN-dependent oxidoreductase (nitrilotriacetate monooxygenase family)
MDLIMFFSPVGQRWTWRQPDAPIEDLWGSDLPARIAEKAELATFDALFIGSWLIHEEGELGQQPFTAGYEPFTLMGNLAARTNRIGLVGTGSTTFLHPYNMARFLSSLDWLSAGRVGWNVVTSSGGAEHYGVELPPHEARYSRAQEYLEVTNALWDAYDDDAVVDDRANAVWARADRIRPIDHRGQHFDISGQLFMHRSPQGRPVIFQAGQSSAGMEFAARNAEVVFTAQTDLDAACAHYAELKARASSLGRDPASIKIHVGAMPIVGATSEDAFALRAELDAQVDVTAGLARASSTMQADLAGLDLDQPIPADRLLAPDSADVEKVFGSRYRNFYEMAVVHKVPLRRLMADITRSVGHLSPIGAAEDVADELQEWFEAGACDGFAISPVSMPAGLDAVCDLLVPELQRRGLARTEYRGVTLRDHLGLSRPPSQGGHRDDRRAGGTAVGSASTDGHSSR